MADYRILIQVDPYARVFNYIDQDTGNSAQTIVLTNRDRVVWVLDPSLPERTFQITFMALNPFQVGTAINFRGSDFVVSSPVNLPVSYPKNPVFKYSVTLGNGWRDDPLCIFTPSVVPEPPDKKIKSFFTLPSASNTFSVFWTDFNQTAIILVPPPSSTVASSGAGANKRAQVYWQWDPSQPQPQTLTLAFQGSIPTGWPPTLNGPVLTFSFPPGPMTNFTIYTLTPLQDQTPTVNGSLTVT